MTTKNWTPPPEMPSDLPPLPMGRNGRPLFYLGTGQMFVAPKPLFNGFMMESCGRWGQDDWNGLSKEAKSTLFDRMGPDYRASMDNVARMASNLRSGSKVFRNPSGTSDATIQAATVGSAVTSLLMGSPAGAAGVAAAVGGANIGAKLLTNPTFVRWLGRNTNRPIGSLNAQIGVLANMGKDDPDITEFVDQLR